MITDLLRSGGTGSEGSMKNVGVHCCLADVECNSFLGR